MIGHRLDATHAAHRVKSTFHRAEAGIVAHPDRRQRLGLAAGRAPAPAAPHADDGLGGGGWEAERGARQRLLVQPGLADHRERGGQRGLLQGLARSQTTFHSARKGGTGVSGAGGQAGLLPTERSVYIKVLSAGRHVAGAGEGDGLTRL